MTKDERIEKWLEGHRKWLKDPKNRKHLSDKNKEFWASEEGEKLKQTNSKRNRKWWRDRPDDEFVLGERIPQRLNGKRNANGYKTYMRTYQQRYREQHKDYYKWLYQKRIGATDLNYDMWKYFNKWRKK